MFRFLQFILFGLMEGLSVWILLSQPEFAEIHRSSWIIGTHFFASSMLVMLLIPLLPESFQKNRNLTLLFMLGLCSGIPLIGPIVVTAFTIILKTVKPEEFSERGFVVGIEDHAKNLEVRSNQEIPHSIVEILNNAGEQHRRNAVLVCSNLHPQLSIPILRKGLQDSDELVRIYAHNVLNRHVETYERSIRRAEAKINNNQKDLNHLIYLAEQYHEMVYLGLITDSEIQDYYVGKAVDYLKRAESYSPKNKHVLHLIMKYSLRIGHIEEAEIYWKRLKSMGYSRELLKPWELEICFQKKDWKTMQTTMKEIQENPIFNSRIESIIHFWFENEESEQEYA